MNLTLTYAAKVEYGNIKLRRGQNMREQVAQCFEGKEIEIKVSRKKRTRTNKQNAYYWQVVVPMVLQGFIDLGHDLQYNSAEHRQMIHDVLKDRHLANGLTVSDANGEVIQLPASTRRCNTVEFCDYIDRVVRWAAENLNIVIPDPGQQVELAL